MWWRNNLIDLGMKCSLLNFLICLVLTVPGYASIRVFDVRIAGFKIGELKATKTILNDSVTQYGLFSEVNFWFFRRVKISYSNISSFLHNQMMTSEVNTESSKGKFRTTSRWNIDRYIISVNAWQYQKDTIIHQPIRFNVARMYFEKPPINTQVYSDGYGILSVAIPEDRNCYRLDIRGSKNKYFFQEAILEKASMDSPIKNYEIIAQD